MYSSINTSQMFAQVIDGQIMRLNLRRGAKIPGVSLGKNSSTADYISNGLYPIVGTKPTYDTNVSKVSGPTYNVVDHTVVKTYVVTDKSLGEMKISKREELGNVFSNKAVRPIVDTGLGFNAQGGYRDIDNELDVTHDITTDQLGLILTAIEISGASLINNKWTLSDAITSATTKEELFNIDTNTGWGII